MIRTTHTYAELPISQRAWNEIAGKLKAAGYDHVFNREGNCIDMSGIGLTIEPDKPVEPGESPSHRVSRALQGIARKLEDMLNKAAGTHVYWSLFVWTGGRASYIANANREDVVTTLKMLMKKWEDGMPDTPAHKVQ